MRALCCLMLCLLSGTSLLAKEKPPVVYSIPIPAKPDFSALQWLVGDWTGKTAGHGAPGEVRLSATFDLEKHFMILRGEVSWAATKTAPAWKESWMGILSANRERAGFVLRVFTSTGFITRYQVTTDGPEIHFNPEGGEVPPPGWLFRRMIQRTGVGEFTETVQVAPPAKSFFEYYSAKLSRVGSPEKEGSAP